MKTQLERGRSKPVQDREKPVGFTVEAIIAMAKGATAIAARCGISGAAVGKWRDEIPRKYAREVAILAGLPIEIVRPDMVTYDYPTKD